MFTAATEAGNVEQQVDDAISEFNEYFKSLQRDGMGLTGPEAAAIKTFCAFVLGLGPGNPRTAPSTERSSRA